MFDVDNYDILPCHYEFNGKFVYENFEADCEDELMLAADDPSATWSTDCHDDGDFGGGSDECGGWLPGLISQDATTPTTPYLPQDLYDIVAPLEDYLPDHYDDIMALVEDQLPDHYYDDIVTTLEDLFAASLVAPHATTPYLSAGDYDDIVAQVEDWVAASLVACDEEIIERTIVFEGKHIAGWPFLLTHAPSTYVGLYPEAEIDAEAIYASCS